ncbi:MAG TPA: glutamate racemase [Methylocystis sp.]|nr:glutamate racemase [Methylocystis sp.]
MSSSPKIIVFDSGLGGLTVFAEVAKLRPCADYLYCADDAAFPYGAWAEPELVARILKVMEQLIASFAPDLVVLACNTASTLALPALRSRWPHPPFVGTVPAIKPAAQISKTNLISVLATPGTVARDYTQKLIDDFAGDCAVKLVGSKHLARYAERHMHGGAVADADIWAEIAPCFVEDGDGRTDVIALACTHYPLLLERFRALAPWEVSWIDPAPAIARRANQMLLGGFGAASGLAAPGLRRAVFTSGKAPGEALAEVLSRYGLLSAPFLTSASK